MAIEYKTARANRRQATLQASLLALMREQDYADITVTDICAAADIPRRTFYHYFSSKEAILDAVVEDLMLACNLSAMLDFNSGMKAMQLSYARFFRFWYEEHRETLELLLSQGLESRLITFTIQYDRSSHLLLPHPAHLKPEIMELGQAAVASSFFWLLFHWCRSGFRETPEELAEYVAWYMTHPFFEP